MDEIKNYLVGEWAVITEAPAIFIMALLVAGFIVWRVMSWAYKSRLDNAKSHIDLQDRQLGDYREKLDGASPDEAKARIAELEGKLSALADELRPRTLTDKQQGLLVQNLRVPVGTQYVVHVSHDMACADGKRLSTQMSHAFRSASGWSVHNPSVMGLGNPPASGLGVYVGNLSQHTDAERIIIDAFNKAGLAFDVQHVARARHPTTGREPHVEVVITTKA